MEKYPEGESQATLYCVPAMRVSVATPEALVWAVTALPPDVGVAVIVLPDTLPVADDTVTSSVGLERTVKDLV